MKHSQSQPTNNTALNRPRGQSESAALSSTRARLLGMEQQQYGPQSGQPTQNMAPDRPRGSSDSPTMSSTRARLLGMEQHQELQDVRQRQVAEWPVRKLDKGTEVYHNTSHLNALNIIQEHIKPVGNAFGGGQLGAGFYTYTERESAELFGHNTTLKFRTTADLQGQEVPKASTWENLEPYAQYVKRNDFLWTDEDPNQYKFHGGANLELVSVYDSGSGEEYSPARYLEMLGID